MRLNQCYQCGQVILTAPDDSSSSTSSTDEETSILEETQRLDNFISLLGARRARLLQRLNELRSSTRIFPPEILSTIFHHVSPSIDFTAADFVEEDEDGVTESHEQITLGAVSRHWRQVVHTTPLLWSTVTINVVLKNAQRKAKLISLYLSHARNTKVSLAVHIFPGHWKFVTGLELQPIFSAIWEGADKFKLLSLCSLPIHWIPLLSADFAHLEDLRLKWAWDDQGVDYHGPQITPLASIPHLRRMNLWGNSAYVPPGPLCTTITILRLVIVPLHVCVQLLLLCPNLIEYRALQSSIDDDAVGPELHEPMIFPQMKIFHSPHSTATQITSVLPYLHFPVLKTLGLELNSGDRGIEALSLFLHRLPTTCSALEVRGFNYEREMLETVLRSTPHYVRSLHLPEVDGWNFGLVLQVLGSATGRTYMPGLRHIHIDSSSQSLQYMDNLEYTAATPELFIDMLSARKDQLGGYFTLEIETNNWILWDRHSDELRKLVLEGLQLQIVMSGRVIQPLQQIYRSLKSSE